MQILGVKIDNLTMDETLQKIEGFLRDNQQHYLVTPNPEFLVKTQEDKEFKEILNQADLAVPDGIGLIWAARFLGQPLKQRITGTDLMEKICQRAAQKEWSVFLLGGQGGVAEKAAKNLKKKYPGLKVQSTEEIIIASETRQFRGSQNEIASSLTLFAPRNDSLSPVILFVAFGAPKQEKWIVQNLEKMPSIKLALGVGGAFNFIAGRIQRAPKFLQRVGLEWLWRLFCQPWRIKRIFKAVIVFPWLVIKSKCHSEGAR
jgi:N-acetylglucosaminyldiphosphoundecaprenol N-acetyl-beta-D-mannosaminyltransferase